MTIIKNSRNDPCPCGSGKKYKQCCLKRDEDIASSKRSEYNSIPQVLQAALEYYQAGHLHESEVLFQKILQTEPNNPDALHLLGLIADEAGKHEVAVDLISRALKFAPNFVEAHINLGSALQEQGELAEAVESFNRAIKINPSIAVAHNNLGNALHKQGKLAEAVDSLHEAIRIEPGNVMAHNNLGVVLQKQGNLAEAAKSYQKAISLKPDYAQAHSNLGDALQRQGKLAEAGESFKRALSLKSDYAEVHNNMGNIFRDQGKLEEALTSYRQALKIKPDYAVAYSNLLFLHSYSAAPDPHEYLVMARNWELECVPALDRLAARRRNFQRLPLAGRRLRLGYVSGDMRQHAVSYFVEQLFAHHDRTRIELFVYSNNAQRDEVTERLHKFVEHFVPIAEMSDDSIRDRIDADDIDVLIDLSGHTAHNRLGVFARRAAPVQAHYLGYFASTGLTAMDYWIGDEIIAPPAMDSHFSEKIWRLPRIWVSYDGKDAPLPDWKPSPDGVVWIGSFNNLGKLTPATLALWAQILQALPEGRLLLKTKELADAGNRQRILDAMAGYGIASDRIDLQPGTPWADYMACYNRLDIALDPVGGHGGGTSTCDALWMGVPVIHKLGDHVGSRFAASMLNAIGYPEWIAESEEEYVAKVVSLARDIEHRKALRFTQREQMTNSSLCDAPGLAKSLEGAYFEMFERWVKKQTG